VPVLQAEVTQSWEAVATVKATHVVVVLAVETSAQEATVVRDSTALHVRDAEDRATPEEREALERVSRMEAENTVVLASSHEDAKGHVRKITLLELDEENSRGLSDTVADAEHWWEVSEREHQEQFEKLTLLQTQGSELCHAIVGPPRERNHYQRGCGLWPSAILKWPENLPHFGQWCLLPWSRR
jgi:hypothetical protein